MIYSLDTNIISYWLKDRFDIRSKMEIILQSELEIVLNPITYYETVRGLLAVNAHRQLEYFDMLCRSFTYREFVKDDWRKAAELFSQGKQTGRPMTDTDIFQAAFCLRNDYTLVTHNAKHFEHLDNLKVEDWVKT